MLEEFKKNEIKWKHALSSAASLNGQARTVSKLEARAQQGSPTRWQDPFSFSRLHLPFLQVCLSRKPEPGGKAGWEASHSDKVKHSTHKGFFVCLFV